MLSFRIGHHLKVSRILALGSLDLSRSRSTLHYKVFQHVQSLIYIYVHTRFSHSESFATLIMLRVYVSTRGVRVRARDETSVGTLRIRTRLAAFSSHVSH